MKLRGEVRTHRCSSPHLLCAVCMYVLLEADIHIFKSNQSYAYFGGTLIITKYRGKNGYKSQPRAKGYSLGHETAQEYLARHNMR